MTQTPPRTDRVALLEKIMARSSTAPAIRRAARTVLNRLTGQITHNNLESLLAGKKLARNTFLSLAARRGCMTRNYARLNTADRLALDVLLALPSSIPADPTPATSESNREWCDFIDGIRNVLRRLKELPTTNTPNK